MCFIICCTRLRKDVKHYLAQIVPWKTLLVVFIFSLQKNNNVTSTNYFCDLINNIHTTGRIKVANWAHQQAYVRCKMLRNLQDFIKLFLEKDYVYKYLCSKIFHDNGHVLLCKIVSQTS